MEIIILKNTETVAAMGADLVGELFEPILLQHADARQDIALSGKGHPRDKDDDYCNYYTDKQHVRPH